MKIKKYLQFISESLEDYDTFGEWIKSLSDDQQVMNIVNRYIDDSTGLYGGDDIEPTIDLVNSLNLLSDRTKDEIKMQVDEYLESGIQEKEPDILASTDTEVILGESMVQAQTEISVAGKGIFTSFLKCLTALGLKESSPNWNECPNDFILYYLFDNLDSESVKSIFSRFKSLTRYLHLIDTGRNEVDLYFGITDSANFEYGFSYDGQRFPIGQFRMTKSTMKWLITLESKSAQSLKKEIVNLSLNDLLILGQIKKDMLTFTPGYFEKRSATTLRDRVLSFGYYGVGKWDNGKLDDGEYHNIKDNFVNWIMTKKWGQKILISLKPNSFWLNIHIKLK